MTEPQPLVGTEAPSSVMTVTEFTGLLTLITGMLSKMEERILGRIDENSGLATKRWERHDEDSKRTLEAIDERFGRVETPLTAHLDEERNEDLVLRARIRPVQTFAGWLARNWRGLAIAAMAVLGLLGLAEGRVLP